jgi:hypothetical protein
VEEYAAKRHKSSTESPVFDSLTNIAFERSASHTLLIKGVLKTLDFTYSVAGLIMILIDTTNWPCCLFSISAKSD